MSDRQPVCTVRIYEGGLPMLWDVVVEVDKRTVSRRDISADAVEDVVNELRLDRSDPRGPVVLNVWTDRPVVHHIPPPR